MANELKMAIVEAIYQLRTLGWSARRIARHLNIDRGTVGKWLRAGLTGSKPAISPAGSEGSKPATNPPAPGGSSLGDGPADLAAAPQRHLIFGELRQIFAVQQDLPAGGRVEARHQSQQRAFATP